MRFHLEALFTMDAAGRLVSVNESGGGPAPRFFLGRTREGNVWSVRHDIDPSLAVALHVLRPARPGANPRETDGAVKRRKRARFPGARAFDGRGNRQERWGKAGAGVVPTRGAATMGDRGHPEGKAVGDSATLDRREREGGQATVRWSAYQQTSLRLAKAFA